MGTKGRPPEPPKYDGPEWIGKPVTPPPYGVGPQWVGQRVSWADRSERHNQVERRVPRGHIDVLPASDNVGA